MRKFLLLACLLCPMAANAEPKPPTSTQDWASRSIAGSMKAPATPVPGAPLYKSPATQQPAPIIIDSTAVQINQAKRDIQWQARKEADQRKRGEIK